MYYDLHTYTNETIGENSLEEIIEFAKKLGLSGIGIVNFFTTVDDLRWPENNEIDIVKVLMIKTNNVEEMEKIAKRVRNRAEILMVHGGDYEINRAACENSLIDVLSRPELNRNRPGLDHICLKAAQENNVTIEVNFREILETYKKHRSYVLSAMRESIRLSKKYNANVITTSGAISKWDLRSGRELASVSHHLGLELGDAIASVSTIPEQLAKQNREKLKDKRWEGVSIVDE